MNHSNKLTVGTDLYRSDLNADSQSGFIGADRLAVEKKSAGVYALDEFSVLENLILSVGYRHEWVKYDLLQGTPRAEDETKDNEPAYSASLSYLFAKKSSAFVSAKRSFRFPVSAANAARWTHGWYASRGYAPWWRTTGWSLHPHLSRCWVAACKQPHKVPSVVPA